MSMKVIINALSVFFCLLGCKGSIQTVNQVSSSVDYMETSVQLLEALKSGAETADLSSRLEKSTLAELRDQLDTDDKKFAFWINVYNAYILINLKAKPGYYDNRREFFKLPLVNIAGEQMSFADIEHGIIRRSQFEYFLGYVRNPFVARYKKQLRPDDKDHRIHFALNCGARSCPPVQVYRPETLDHQLEASSNNFLTEFSSYDSEKKSVLTTPLFSWFRGDFNGKKGTKRILKKYGVIPTVDVELKFDEYDWTLYLDNFVD